MKLYLFRIGEKAFFFVLALFSFTVVSHEEVLADEFMPSNPSSEYLSELAQLNVRYEQLPEAVKAFEAAIKEASSTDERGRNAFSLAQILIRMQKPEAATNAFHVAMEAKPNDVQFLCKCHTYVAQCLLQLKKTFEAESSLRYVMANSADDWEKTHARDQLFTLLIQLGRSGELIKTLQDQLGGDTNNPALLLELAVAYGMQTNGQETALGLYSQVLAKDPTNKEALERTITIHRSTGRFKDAVELILRLFNETKDQDRRKELADRAATLCRMVGDVSNALVWQAKTAELDPQNPVPLLKLADTYASRGDWTNAIASYQGAVSKAKSDAERESYAMLLIQTQVRAGKSEDAEAGIRQLAETGSTEQVRSKAKRMLFEIYEKQGRLGEISFPPSDPVSEGTSK